MTHDTLFTCTIIILHTFCFRLQKKMAKAAANASSRSEMKLPTDNEILNEVFRARRAAKELANWLGMDPEVIY